MKKRRMILLIIQSILASKERGESRNKANFLDICTKMFLMQILLEVYEIMIRIWK
jgi:hypothetical protein